MVVQIAVSPAVKQYLLANFDGEPIKLSSNRVISKFIAQHLQPVKKPVVVKGHHVKCLIPERMMLEGKTVDFRSAHFALPPAYQALINETIEAAMRSDLFARLEMLEERGEICRKFGKMKEEIHLFREKYGILEEEWPYETLKKAYYRHRQRGNTLTHMFI